MWPQSSGAVYVFTRPEPYRPYGLLGYAVGLRADGNTMAVSAYDEDSSAREINGAIHKMRRKPGAIYVFNPTGNNWAQTAYLKASNAENGDSLGSDMAISQDGNTIVGRTGYEDCFAEGVNPKEKCDDDFKTDTSTGATYVFVNSGGTWTQQAFIKASHPGKEDWFGSRLNISGDGNTLGVCAQLENGNSEGINGNEKDLSAEDPGALYLFTRTGATWASRLVRAPKGLWIWS